MVKFYTNFTLKCLALYVKKCKASTKALLTYCVFDAVIFLGEFVAVANEETSSPDIDVSSNLQVRVLVEFLVDCTDLRSDNHTVYFTHHNSTLIPVLPCIICNITLHSLSVCLSVCLFDACSSLETEHSRKLGVTSRLVMKRVAGGPVLR